MKSLLFIINPHSGKKTIKSKLCEIINSFIQHDYEVSVHITQAPQDITKIIEARGNNYDLCICSGGDGSLNEFIHGCINCNYQNAIGYIPAGTTNDFATTLKLSKDPIKCANQIMEGTPKYCDVGLLNQLPFIYIAAFGSLADVSYTTPQVSKNILGHSAYVLEGMKQLVGLKKYRLNIEYDGEIIRDTFCYGMITNTLSVGGMHFFNEQDIDLNDGYFECLFVKYPNNPLDVQQILQAFISKDLKKCSRIYLFKAKHLKIHGRKEVSWTIDGEFGGSYKEVEVLNKNNAIKIIR